MAPTYTPPAPPADPFTVAVWRGPRPEDGPMQREAWHNWYTVAWTSTRSAADSVAEAWLLPGYHVQIWWCGEMVWSNDAADERTSR